MDTVEVNGPADVGVQWDVIDWRTHEQNVARLRRRIFKATREQDWATVRSLQKLMLGSWSNTLVSVRQVTQRNAGRRTAGIDGETALSSEARAEVAVRLHRTRSSWVPLPVRRVYIPKANGKQRPLGIPALMDRCHQARVRNALEPEWEARFEPRSYGFRPGRSCADAIESLFATLKGPLAKRVWILDADLSAAFDKIDHSRLLDALGGFPARGLVEGWLKAGVIETGTFSPTEEGSPQGGVISPLLLNVALHGLEEAAGVRYRTASSKAGEAAADSPVLVRYADDFAVCCHSRQQAEQVKARLAGWLAPRGLTFNEDKTRIVHLEEDGFDFLGFNVRRYRGGQSPGKLLIKPSPAAVKRVRHRLAVEMRRLRGSNARAVIARLNPIIRGWTSYYRGAVSSQIFTSLDAYMWRLTYRWARRCHPKKSRHWVTSRYFGRFHKFRNDRWVFGDPQHPYGEDGDTIAYLAKFAWTDIVRHPLVASGASPDDPDLRDYWIKRRRKIKPALDSYNTALLARQGGRCPLCGDHLLTADQPQSPHEWERWWLGVVKRAIAADYLTHHGRDGTMDGTRTRLVHASCHRSVRARRRNQQPATSAGLA
ncbi:group II intron reverse transcriptase/maturase [Rhodococcus sp. 2H158]|nr:reverse transcriptase [Rhodococcus rhodochrous]